MAGSTRKNAITEVLSCLPTGKAFCLIKTSECRTQTFCSLGHCSTHCTHWQKTDVFNFIWFSPAGLTRAQLPPTQRTATRPQVGEVPTSPSWALLGQHGHLQVHTPRTRGCCGEGFAEGCRLGEEEVRSPSAAEVPSLSHARI